MSPCVHSLIRRASAPLLLFLVVSAVGCYADSYSNEGTVTITGTITAIQDQQICDLYNCHIGSTWTLQMIFAAPQWDAPGSNYTFTDVLLNCFGGPPCFIGYQATSDFGWAPYGFDMLSVDIEDGHMVDARAACGGYFVEWGEDNSWSYYIGFSGTTTGYADTTPDPATIVTLASGMAVIGARLKIPRVTG